VGAAFLFAKGVITIGNKNGVNWHKVRAEYVNGTSQAKLAKKYGVSRTMISNHCRSEGWTQEREKAKAEILQNVIQKTADLAADNATIAAGIKRKALMILDKLFDGYLYDSTEHQVFGPGSKDISRLRDLTAAYKDLTEDLPKPEEDKNGPIYELLRRIDDECGV
jgi:dsRNA-specific ribonuclease